MYTCAPSLSLLRLHYGYSYYMRGPKYPNILYTILSRSEALQTANFSCVRFSTNMGRITRLCKGSASRSRTMLQLESTNARDLINKLASMGRLGA